ncbi:hypothetical protein FB645_003713 [Coemansia sp. IMI 203386]|nr:hypothetical protein FB645_003713 [Coemansia sp. IMI 203386]
MSLNKYSLWLSPPAGSEQYRKLDLAISKFSSMLESPRFSPHLTLHSPVYAESDADALQQVRDYVQKLYQSIGDSVRTSGIPVGIRDVATGTKFYQCVLLHAPNSNVLLEANAIAREKWKTAKDPTYYPHVSLFYGDCESDKREALAKQIRDSLPVDMQTELSFTAQEVRIIATVGPCEEWRDIGSVSLTTGEITSF